MTRRLRVLPGAVLLGLSLTLATACTGSGGAPAGGDTVEAAPTPDPGVPLPTPGPPPPPGATGPPVVGISSLAPVPVGQPGGFGNGLVATVTKVDPVQVEARGPGEIAGPGVGVTVELDNGTPDPVDLGGVVVNAYYRNGIPADSSDSAPAAAATGPLAPGQTRQGVYVFRVPSDAADSLVVEVNYNGSPNVVLIRR